MLTLTNFTSLKHGPHRVQPEIFFALNQIREVVSYAGGYAEIIALLDGNNLHHYAGYEVDLRLEDVDLEEIEKALGPCYSVEREGSDIVHVRFK